MQIRPLKLEGAFEISLVPRSDERGYFMRAYDEEIFHENGLQTQWVQENQSRSLKKHTIRGLHFQKPPHSETKLIRVLRGAILDVFVDLRKNSKSYGQWVSLELSADNQKIAYIPKGFAHAFCSLTDDVVVLYKVDNAYAPGFEGGLIWNDKDLNIQWPTDKPVLSEKDRQLGSFRDFISPF
jgi:dTDP-4-dehydrorhamnose 3,5-epimerase